MALSSLESKSDSDEEELLDMIHSTSGDIAYKMTQSVPGWILSPLYSVAVAYEIMQSILGWLVPWAFEMM